MKNTVKIKIPKGYVALRPFQKIKSGDLCQWSSRPGDQIENYFYSADLGRRIKKKDFLYIRRAK